MHSISLAKPENSSELRNSERIVAQYDLTILDSYFPKAERIPAHGTLAGFEFETHRFTGIEATPQFGRVAFVKMGDTGFDSPHDSSRKVQSCNKSGAHSGARDDANAILADRDAPRLLELIEAWPTLSEDVRDAIAMLVRAELDANGVTATLAEEAVAR